VSGTSEKEGCAKALRLQLWTYSETTCLEPACVAHLVLDMTMPSRQALTGQV